ALLGSLGLLRAENLGEDTASESSLSQRVLQQMGFDEPQTQAALKILMGLARTTKESWSGHVQVFLREHGQRMVSELTRVLERLSIENVQARKVATIWLQNVCNMPV